MKIFLILTEFYKFPPAHGVYCVRGAQAGTAPAAPGFVRLNYDATEELRMINYQKEYSILMGTMDRAISILEQHGRQDAIVQAASAILLEAMLKAEERHLADFD